MGSRPSFLLQSMCSLSSPHHEGPPSGGIVGLLLCAGWGRRHGGDKLQQTLPDGRTVAQRAAHQLQQGGCDRVVAVLRPNQQALGLSLGRQGVGVVWSDAAAAGMGHSLAAGVQVTAGAHGWVVALGDMPMVQPATIAQVVVSLKQGASIVTVHHQGQRGHPVGWAASWGHALAELGGDRGARELLWAHHERTQRLDVHDPGVLFDIDTPEALSALWAHWPEVPPASEVPADLGVQPPLGRAA